MGAVETMEEFFEKLNAGDRQGAVDLMDEKTEMRVHVGDNVQTLRGVERVGGWFLRGDAGLRMIPGEIRDTGNTYEADVLVVRPALEGAAVELVGDAVEPVEQGVAVGDGDDLRLGEHLRVRARLLGVRVAHHIAIDVSAGRDRAEQNRIDLFQRRL